MQPLCSKPHLSSLLSFALDSKCLSGLHITGKNRTVEASTLVEAMELAAHGICFPHLAPYTQTSGLPQGFTLVLIPSRK